MRFGGRADYLACAERFWRDYRAEDTLRLCDEDAVVRELGCLLLARIDGKSPVEYVEDESTKEAVRGVGAELLTGPEGTVPQALAVVAAHRPREYAA
jgi:5-methylthioribose kinase